MSFDVSAEAYQQFMGRFSDPLAVVFAELVDLQAGQRALDVGCGTGALTAVLRARLGSGAVSAVDPSPSFVAATQARLPDVDVRLSAAEHLPWLARTFDLSMAALVVPFMSDPVAGLTEMARVTRPGGVVAASVWDHDGGGSPLSLYWRVVHELDPTDLGESGRAGAREGQLAQLCEQAGLIPTESTVLTIEHRFTSFEDWWHPFTLGVGPAGAHAAQLDSDRLARIRSRCQELFPAAPFAIAARAWCVFARA